MAASLSDNFYVMWTEVLNDTDIESLKIQFGDFHDSCIRDLYISTSEFVDEKRAMSFSNDLTASLLFQRQFKTNTVLELKFIGLRHLSFHRIPDDYTAVLYDSTLKFENGLFYWADFADWNIADFESGYTEGVWVSGKRLFWRFRFDLIGNVNRVDD